EWMGLAAENCSGVWGEASAPKPPASKTATKLARRHNCTSFSFPILALEADGSKGVYARLAGYSVIRPPVPPNLAAATRRCSLRNYDAATTPRWRERVVYHFSKVPRPIQQMPVSFSSSSRRRRRAIIIGGSMSGLFAAAFLRQKGWDTDVYERSMVELVGRGAGITTHPELLDALRQSGAGTRDLGIEVEKRIALDRDGRVIAEKY